MRALLFMVVTLAISLAAVGSSSACGKNGYCGSNGGGGYPPYAAPVPPVPTGA